MAGITITGASIREPGRAVVPAVNTWSRLEGLPLSADLQPALRAEVADPLWFLCRQWQFLEFAGEDAGTPIDVRVEGECAVLSRVDPVGAAARDYSAEATALETAVEAEPVRRHHTRLAVEAGMHLQWILDNGRLNDLFVLAYPLDPVPAVDTDADRDGADWLELARVRGIDARRLLDALAPLRDADGTLTGLPPRPVVPEDQRARTLDALRRWIAWYEAAFVDPPAADSWNPSRLEYSFTASARTANGELVLAADEYTDGTLDWYSVDTVTGSSGATVPPTTIRPGPLLPSPVEYPGKPADRFWEFEDATVHFGGIDAGPTDLARMLLVEFDLVYGNDWFVVPLRLPVGSLFRITGCTVRDTFGVVTSLTRSRNLDGPRWALFDIGGDQFFLAPTLAQSLTGEPIERVQLARDESANLAWGIEQRVAGASGDPYERSEEASIASGRPLDGPPVDAALVYRLATEVPEHWIPYVPVSAGPAGVGNPVIRLERRSLLRTGPDGQQERVDPKGVLLQSLRIDEEEVPRDGAVVERAFQYARWFDGRSLLWLGRRKRVGKGEASSGLRFDSLHRPGATRAESPSSRR